ncbi:MAG: hypothetical protein KUF79_15235 [Candidatus Thiodiazotropha sp. (ex Ctena orbiculata)]|nr:hypothetical protein [Candidatus Thiodiazotropha taylori]
MKLYLVQHGEACAKEIDPDRPGSVVCLELTNDLRWQIDWMLRPELFR